MLSCCLAPFGKTSKGKLAPVQEKVDIAGMQETVKVGNRPMDEFPHTYYVVREPRYIMTTSLIIFADGKNNDPHVLSAQQQNQNLEQAGRWPNFSIVLFVLIALASMVARCVWS